VNGPMLCGASTMGICTTTECCEGEQPLPRADLLAWKCSIQDSINTYVGTVMLPLLGAL
jgi:hypothetical protein